jgi:hypothetical protein
MNFMPLQTASFLQGLVTIWWTLLFVRSEQAQQQTGVVEVCIIVDVEQDIASVQRL